MARLVEGSRVSKPIQGMGSVNSPAHTQADCMESDLSRSCLDMFGFIKWKKKGKGKPTPAERPRALRKGSRTSKLVTFSPKGPQT
eukprot:243440-Pelagomonas_calceolata.AAC.1